LGKQLASAARSRCHAVPVRLHAGTDYEYLRRRAPALLRLLLQRVFADDGFWGELKRNYNKEGIPILQLAPTGFPTLELVGLCDV
jgi:hypothetical protein